MECLLPVGEHQRLESLVRACVWLEGGQEGRVMTQKHKKQTQLMINVARAEENAGEDVSSLNLLRTNTADKRK